MGSKGKCVKPQQGKLRAEAEKEPSLFGEVLVLGEVVVLPWRQES